MNDTCSSGSLRSPTNSPTLDLILAAGEVVNKLEGTVASDDETIDHGWCTELLSNSLSSFIFWAACSGKNFSFVLSGVRKHRTTSISLNPLLDFGEPLVLLGDILVTSNVG